MSCGPQREAVCPWQKLAKEEEERQEERETPCLLARLSINTSYIKSIIRNMHEGLALTCCSRVPWFPNA